MERVVMKVGVANKGGVYSVLPSLLNSLPHTQAKFYEPFESYDLTIGFKMERVREIKFEPENEILEDFYYPATIPYLNSDPLKIDRGVCLSAPKVIRQYESIFNHIGRLVVENNYTEVRSLIHKSIPVEESKNSCGIQVILDSGYSAKIQLLSAIMRKQPFVVFNFEGAAEILRTLRCVSPWMLPFDTITEAAGRIEFLKMTANMESTLEEARQKCLSERLHSRNLHIWARVLHG
jgi:hypothetical protein